MNIRLNASQHHSPLTDRANCVVGSIRSTASTLRKVNAGEGLGFGLPTTTERGKLESVQVERETGKRTESWVYEERLKLGLFICHRGQHQQQQDSHNGRVNHVTVTPGNRTKDSNNVHLGRFRLSCARSLHRESSTVSVQATKWQRDFNFCRIFCCQTKAQVT